MMDVNCDGRILVLPKIRKYHGGYGWDLGHGVA